jgi:predicted MFS family arabinose efflux permease
MVAPAAGGLLADTTGYASVLYAGGTLVIAALATAIFALRLHGTANAPASEESQSPPLI